MSIASRIEQIEQHLKDDYDVLGLAGAKGTELPIGYTQVDYIESSGTQYIDTGYTPNINTEVIIEFKDTNKSNWENYFGSENFRFLRHASDSTAFRWQCVTNADITNLSIDNKRKLKFNKNGIYDENGTLILSNLQTSLTSTKNMLLFLSWLGSSFDNFGIFMMYSFKIYDNGTLVRNFIPCYRNSDNEVGMYDLVNDVFYTNKGTGAFTYGSVVLNRNIQNLKQAWEERLLYFLANGTDTLWNNWNKITGSGETITLNNTIEAKMDFVYKGNTSQTGTPTPDNPIPVQVVSGDNTIKVERKNLANFKTINSLDIINGYVNLSSTYSSGFTATITIDEIILPAGNYTLGFKTSSSQTITSTQTLYINNSTEIGTINYYNDYCYANITLSNTTTISNFKAWFPTGAIGILSEMILIKGTYNTTNIPIYEPYQTPQTYPINLGNIELCKIGTYQDKIYKDNGKWYLNKQIGKVVLDGSESGWHTSSLSVTGYKSYYIESSIRINQDATGNKCNYFEYKTFNEWQSLLQATFIENSYQAIGIRVVETLAPTLEDFKTWLSTHNTTAYYVLATPTTTEITDTTLISQLEAIKKSYNTQTNISQTNADKPFILDVVALGNN